MKLKLILREITLEKALDVLNLTKADLGDTAKIKAAYRKATLDNHPDRGGDVEKSKDVNLAYELISKQSKAQTNRFDWEGHKKKQEGFAEIIKTDLHNKFNPKMFEGYFSSVYGESFQSTMDRLKINNSSVYMYWSFATADRSIVFKFEVYCDSSDASQTSSLGGGQSNISYKISIVAYGLYNNKKLKITQRDWNSTNNHDVLTKPEISFPKTKLEKFKTTSSTKVFKKQDMVAVLTNKLGTSWDGEDARIQLASTKNGDPYNLTLVLRRMTFMKMGTWNILLFKNSQGVPGMTYHTFLESLETAQKFEELIKGVKSKSDPDDKIQYVLTKCRQMKDESKNS